MPVQHKASYSSPLEHSKVRCLLCPHNCTIVENAAGVCGVRKNIGGVLYTEIYGKVTAVAMDPIEKKPLYHFYPGSRILSIGTRGCNMKCFYCQNWHISQDVLARATDYTPEQIVQNAHENKSIGIAYTYSEPLIWFEFVMDTSRLARKSGLKNVLVTNGFVNSAPLDEMLPLIDAMNVDLKTFRDETYRRVQKGRLEDVCATIKRSHAAGCHVEVTTLVVTGVNDTMDEMRDIISFIESVDKTIPWHISRYYPNYKYDAPATDIRFIMDVCREASAKLSFVYCGNVPGSQVGSATKCPSCGTEVISRSGYHVTVEHVKNGRCAHCGADLYLKD